VFPVLRSKADVGPLARLLESAYSLRAVHCQLIKGTVRDTYLVTSHDGPYIFSIYGHADRTVEEISAEMDLLDHLTANGLTVPSPLRSIRGERLLQFDAPEGIRFGALFSYIPGEHLDRRPDPDLARRFGRAVASVHQLSDTLSAPLLRPWIDFDQMVDVPIKAFAAMTQRTDAVDYLQDVAGMLCSRFTALPSKPPYVGLVHGDVIPSNAQIMLDGKLALLDFDFCGYGWRVYDIATYLGEVTYWDAGAAVAEAFVAGYEEVRPMAEWERSAIPLFEAARHIHSFGTPAAKVNEWGSAYLSDQMIDTLLDGIRSAVEKIN
jgi:Ser/Thr protein kinase RdoA (MazF antagonist)